MMNGTKEATMPTAPAPKVHVFELAGLGVAPFRYTGSERRVYVACQGADEQPGGSCDLCGAGIKLFCWIEDANGRRFKVGSDCVAKTGDKGLRRLVDADVRRRARDAKWARESVKIEAARAKLAEPSIRERLSAEPHSRGFKDRETGRELTRLDELEWLLAHAGTSGRLGVAKILSTMEA
jgi:hypothetical protein